jgi:hypothetical protein
MDQDAVNAVVREIEEEQAYGRVAGVKVFRGMLNQPTLVSVSSVNATAVASGDSFSSFTVDMPRPILEVDNLQLATVNIPLCTQNIPDTACVFWYYRLSLYSGKYPNTNNLYWVRLLPSYYKPEFIKDYENYGFNKTFGGYSDVSEQLALATTRDLALDHFTTEGIASPSYRFQYFPDNYTLLGYNSSKNKFEFVGNYGLPNDTSPIFIVTRYQVGDTYALGKVVLDSLNYVQGYGYLCYKSRVAGNVGNPLPVYPAISTAFWEREFSAEGVASWSGTTGYRKGQFVRDPVAGVDTLYRALQGSYAQQPGQQPAYWQVNPAPAFPYRFLATGPSDPNVLFMQGSGKRKWQEDALFEQGDIVVYKGTNYQARMQTLNTEPFYIPNSTDNLYSNARQYQVGDYAFVAGNPGRFYINIVASLGASPPPATATNNANWNFIEWDPNRPSNIGVPPATSPYLKGDLITYVGYTGTPFFRCIKDNPPAGHLPTSAFYGEDEYWEASFWNPTTSAAPVVGLTDLSEEYDMANDLQGLFFAPFPASIPPQPFVPNPKRLLNSILGFTWNGKFTNSMFNTLYAAIPTSGSTNLTQLYNRLRPVPEYVVTPPGDTLTALPGAGSAILNFILTANGYANLVYTAIINVYATIVGGSTLDTQRNTNLMGTMAMNAGNLGIGFGANYIEVPLRAGDGDIYSVTFEFRDDYDEPYPITNNAAVTITLKLGYKESRK